MAEEYNYPLTVKDLKKIIESYPDDYIIKIRSSDIYHGPVWIDISTYDITLNEKRKVLYIGD